jgi:hypothetical protein
MSLLKIAQENRRQALIRLKGAPRTPRPSKP